MKFVTYICLIILLSEITFKSINSLSVSETLSLKAECSEKYKVTGAYQLWKKDVEKKLGQSTYGIDCKSEACRSFEEMVFIGFCKQRQLRKIIKRDILLVKFDKDLVSGGVTKLLMIMNGVQAGNGMQFSALFSICIPVNRLKYSYLIYRCPLNPCLEDYEEAAQCNNKVRIPKQKLDFHLLRNNE